MAFPHPRPCHAAPHSRRGALHQLQRGAAQHLQRGAARFLPHGTAGYLQGSAARRRQRGAALAAFTVTAPSLLFCALFTVEAARWHATRQALHLALLEAARTGATTHARPAAIEQAFETALLPLFHPPGAHGSARERMRASFLAVAQQTGAPPWRIDLLSPTASAYADFADAALRVPGAPGMLAINNDYQAEQHQRRRRMGWPGGRGARSGQTIFDANTLRLRLTYAHPPLVPGVRAVLRSVAAMRGARDAAARAGMLVMAVDLALPMQSHPVQWQAAGIGSQFRPTLRSERPQARDARQGHTVRAQYRAPAAHKQPMRERQPNAEAIGRAAGADHRELPARPGPASGSPGESPAGAGTGSAESGGRNEAAVGRAHETAADGLIEARDGAWDGDPDGDPDGAWDGDDGACGVVLCCVPRISGAPAA